MAKEVKKLMVVYGIDDKPPLIEAIFLGFQHYLTMFGATIIIPILIAGVMGMPTHETGLLISTMFFVSGITTLLQTTWGNRLPIVQGGTFSFLPPFFAIVFSATLAGAGWEMKIQYVQGAIIIGSFFEMALGFTGAIGYLKKYLGPITIAPTIALIGLALYAIGWPWLMYDIWIGGIALLALIIYSQFLSKKYRLFLLFPVILSIFTAWAIAFATGRIDTTALKATIDAAPWIRIPYPFQWGMPQFSAAFAVGMLAGYLASIVESVGDYYACARMSGAPIPSAKKISRGIGFEGVGCLVAGLIGTGNGTTSYSENIGAIGITKVGSRYVVQIGAIVMLLLGAFGKFGAFFTSIPMAIVGAMFCGLFGMIASVGLSNLQFVDMNDSRNLFIIGFAFFMGLSVPFWAKGGWIWADVGAGYPEGFLPPVNQLPINWEATAGTLGRTFAEILTTIAATGMAVAAIIAGILDNILPGTRESRGLTYWEDMAEE